MRGSTWLASLEGFYKEVDGITTDTQGFQNEAQFNGEIGSYTVYGVESLLNFNFSHVKDREAPEPLIRPYRLLTIRTTGCLVILTQFQRLSTLLV